MKSIVMLLLCAITINNAVIAQKIDADKVPAVVLSTFKTKFSTATQVSWELENADEYEAEFKFNGNEYSANFDKTGKWLETETEIKSAALPEAILKKISTEFNGFDIEEIEKAETWDKGTVYEVEIEKGKENYELIISSTTQILKKEEKKEEKED